MKVRIIDIVKKAGDSAGTEDRIIHQRNKLEENNELLGYISKIKVYLNNNLNLSSTDNNVVMSFFFKKYKSPKKE